MVRSKLLTVAAVSLRPEISEMLQRYVGGILKGLATVEGCAVNQALEKEYDLYVVYTMGIVYYQLKKTIETERIIPAQLFPMPQGIKRILMLPEDSHLGIIGGHIWDSADLLGQLVSVGVRNYRFSTGTQDMMAGMKVDYFVLPEEIALYVKEDWIKKKAVIIPRALDSRSVADIISKTIKCSEKPAYC